MTEEEQKQDFANQPMFAPNEMVEIVGDFIVESRDLIEQLGHDLLDLENRPNDKELQKKIFRAVHTIKGTSSFLGFTQMSELTHCLEDVLNKLRKDTLELTSIAMDVIFDSYDLMKVLLDRIENKEEGTISISHAIEQLQDIARSSEFHEQHSSIKSPITENEGLGVPAPNRDSKPLSKSLTTDSFIRVEVNRLNGLMDLVGELVIARNRLGQISQQFGQGLQNNQLSEQVADTSSNIDFITTELQMAVMKTRMVSIDKVFGKLPRLVRDLSRELSKDIELQIESEATELDKTIIDELNDPLIHILRNAVDHGIEPADDRKKIGKPEKGHIKISAVREGNYIVITVSDDGKGIDYHELIDLALEKGMLTEARSKEITEREALSLIFEAGFSTAKKVTNVSGRGVGLDVVAANITKLKGIVDVESNINIGTTFTLRIPLTLAIVEGLLVEAGGEIYSVPLNSILEVIRIDYANIETIDGKKVFCHRDSILPLASLAEVMKIGTRNASITWKYLVVVGFAEQRFGIIVDELLGQKELVIKSLGTYLGNVTGIAGSTILGDGKVVMILDIGQFMKLCRDRM